MNPQDLSDFEKCARIPLLGKKWEPERWPVREAVKRYIAEGLSRDPELVADDFLREAADRGFEYPEGEPFELAKDYASWIDGALRIAAEYPADVVRVVSELGQRRLRWPELIKLGVEEYTEVSILQLRLPAVHKRRLASPLNLSYRQPITGSLRLARLDTEKISFGPSWKRVGRWEVPEVPWSEWRDGIDRDRCMSLIAESYVVPSLTSEEKRRVQNDIEHMLTDMNKLTHPRKWEACESCLFKPVCHGHKEGFIRIKSS